MVKQAALAVAFVALAALLACEHQITDYVQQPNKTVTGDRTRFVVHVKWMSGVDEIDKECGFARTTYGCARSLPLFDDDGNVEWHCYVTVMRPKDFNDVPRLAILGHEIEHCTGSEH